MGANSGFSERASEAFQLDEHAGADVFLTQLRRHDQITQQQLRGGLGVEVKGRDAAAGELADQNARPFPRPVVGGDD